MVTRSFYGARPRTFLADSDPGLSDNDDNIEHPDYQSSQSRRDRRLFFKINRWSSGCLNMQITYTTTQ